MHRVTLLALMITAVFCIATAAPQNPFFPPQHCGANEATYPCGRTCEAVCNKDIPDLCKGLQCEGFTCRCKNGFARNEKTKQCVAVDDCPKE